MSEDFEKITFESDIGHKAKVDRNSYTNEETIRCNKKLREIGKELQPDSYLEYKGSAAFHLYIKKSQIAGGDELYTITQCDTLDSNVGNIANKGMLSLDKDLSFKFTGKRKVNRSGF